MRIIPKVIENLRESILREARKELFEEGYLAFNIRTVAGRCEVAVGTFYNYFSSKEMLAATIVLEDWIGSLTNMEQAISQEKDVFGGLEAIYNELLQFEQLYHDIFKNSAAIYSKYFSRERHKKLREQLESPIGEVIAKSNKNVDPFIVTCIAENFLGASQERVTFKKLEGILKKILV